MLIVTPKNPQIEMQTYTAGCNIFFKDHGMDVILRNILHFYSAWNVYLCH